MKTRIIFISLLILFFSCKKEASKPMTVTDADLQGKWNLISETTTGTWNQVYKAWPSDYIEYNSDGKAYSNLQGQVGFVYSYELNPAANNLHFQYMSTLPNLQLYFPCAGSPGCPRIAEIKFISKNLLVLGNTFKTTAPNGVVVDLTILDSLSR